MLVDTDDGSARTLEQGQYAYALTWSRDGRQLAWRDDVGGVDVVALDTGRRQHFADTSVVAALAFSADGARLFGGGVGKLWTWDPVRGTGAALSPWHELRIRALAVSPDGTKLASAGEDRTVRLLDLGSRATVVLAGHAAEVGLLAFAPDGATLASADAAGAVRVWDVATGDVQVLRGHQGPERSLSYAPSGDGLVSASADRVIVWDLTRLPAPLADAASVAAAVEAESSVVLGPDDRPVTPID